MNTDIEIKLVEWFDQHWYKVNYNLDDKEATIYIPSVTTKLGVIAKPFLAKWRGDIGNREADMRVFEACERGVRIHHGWYTLTTGGAVVYQPFQRPNYTNKELEDLSEENTGNLAVIRYQDEMFDLWKLQRWLDAVKPKLIASEMTVYSLTNKDAGTVDNVMEIEGGEYNINGSKPLNLPKGRYVVDLKTGNQVDDNAYWQTACYSKCLEEMNTAIDGTLILHTGSRVRSGIEGLSTLYHTKEQLEEDYKGYRLASALWEVKNADAKPSTFEFPSMLKLKETEK